MQLFHASINTYSVGSVITSHGASTYYPVASANIDAVCPPGVVNRSLAVYSADSPEFCVHFLMKQGVSFSDVNLYRVSAVNPHKCPFAVTHAVHRKIERGFPVDRLTQEYWSPTLSWKFYEYLAESITVIEVLKAELPNDIILMHQYSQDCDLANGIS